MNDSTRYADYTVRIGEETVSGSEIDIVDGRPATFFFRIFRVPSKKEFVLRTCPRITDEERAYAIRVLNSMPSDGWTRYPSKYWFKRRSSAGHYFWKVFGGRYVDDPLVQLELEMMIDLQTPPSTSARKGDPIEYVQVPPAAMKEIFRWASQHFEG